MAFFDTIKTTFKTPGLRNKVFYTLFILLIFRLGSHITAPFVNTSGLMSAMGDSSNTFFGYLNLMSGGAFDKATIFALSITPYINASIIVQLLTVAIPALERIAIEGVAGRKKLKKITRYLGIGLALVQGAGLYVTLMNMQAVQWNLLEFIVIVLTFTAGTAFIVWLGEVITEKGLGNGVSMIIFAGIVTRIPSGIVTVYQQFLSNGLTAKGLGITAAITIVAIAAIVFVIFFTEAERRIPVQYAKRVVGRKMYGGQRTNIPIKIAAGGVMPIIFASSIMAFPATIVRLVSGGNMPQEGIGYYILGCLSAGYSSAAWTSVVYAVLYFLLIIFFTYFYSTIQFNPIELSNQLKKNGGVIPSKRPGKQTSDYIAGVTSRLNLIGSIFLGIIAVLPVVFGAVFKIQGMQIGGTSLLIMEGVALETVRQIESQMVTRNYKGFLN